MPQKRSTRNRRPSRKAARDLDLTVAFFEGLVQRAPEYVEALQILGDLYTQRGSFDQSLRVDRQLSRLEPRNPLVFYNLACSYSRTGDLDLAASSLGKALKLGYRDFRWLAKDPDLRALRQHPIFRAIQAKIREMRVRAR